MNTKDAKKRKAKDAVAGQRADLVGSRSRWTCRPGGISAACEGPSAVACCREKGKPNVVTDEAPKKK